MTPSSPHALLQRETVLRVQEQHGALKSGVRDHLGEERENGREASAPVLPRHRGLRELHGGHLHSRLHGGCPSAPQVIEGERVERRLVRPHLRLRETVAAALVDADSPTGNDPCLPE